MIIFVSATDNVAVTDLLLTLDGTALVMDANGMATIHADQVGSFEVAARATDAAGNVATAGEILPVIDPDDTDAPSSP